MNPIMKNVSRAGVCVAAALLALACSDTWDDHYSTAAEYDYSGTTLEYLASQSDLSDFYKIVVATDFDDELASSQVLTVFAPQNGTFNYDSLAALISEGKTTSVLERFVENHITRYNISLGNEEQEVTLLNEKLVDVGTLSTLLVGDVSVANANISCTNGVLQELDGYLPYRANIFEQLEILNDSYLETATDTDSIATLYEFLLVYDEEELDEDQSVARGLDEDGNTVYVDSVTIHNNEVLEALDAYLYREDSTYMMIYPSEQAYKERVTLDAQYFNFNYSYSSDETVRDSMQNYYANYYALNNLLYNMNDNQHDTDSLFSTSYNRNNWEYNVFYNPYSAGGLLDPSTIEQEIECSNGTIYVVDDYPYTIYDAFYHKIEVEGEETRYLVTDESYTNTNTSTTTYTNSADSISNGRYIVIASTSNSQTKAAYYIPNTLSGSYDVYVKTLPQSVRITDSATVASSLPARYQFTYYERNEKGEWPSSGTQFKNPEDGTRYYVFDAFNIDTVYIGTVDFSTCFYGTDAGVMLMLQSYVLTSQRNTYSKELYLDAIFLVPTEESEDADSEDEE